MKNPVRFLLHVPVPWVFVLTYLIGVVLEHLRHGTISPTAALVSTTAGTGLFAVGAVIAGWGLVLFRKARTTTVPGKLSGKLLSRGLSEVALAGYIEREEVRPQITRLSVVIPEHHEGYLWGSRTPR